MKIAFISRTKNNQNRDKSLNGLLKESEDLKELLREVAEVTSHEIKAYIVAGFELEGRFDSLQVKIIRSENSTSSVSMNSVFSFISSKMAEFVPDAFLVCSKEVDLKKDHIITLAKEISDDPCLLVVGYRFTIKDDKLDNELKGYYANKNLIAYRVPWNTCTIWNYKLFNQYVKKFDEITLGKYPFGDVVVTIDGVSKTTEHKGMEDGLAIAQAVSQSKDVRFKLLKECLTWTVAKDNNKIEKHRKKLARKDYVMRNFMALRNYSVDDLEAAEIK